jgi:hypothetical protein
VGMLDFGVNGSSIFSPEGNGLIGGYQSVPSTPQDIKRTQTRLVLSEDWHAAEKWLLDPRLPDLFQYQFGGPFWVVIPKGRIVSVATNGGPNNDGLMNGYISRLLFNALTFANGGVNVLNETDASGSFPNGTENNPPVYTSTYTRTANRPIGVAAQNIIEQRPDDMADILPDVLSRGTYIELPLIDNMADAAQIQWGSAYGVLHGGDYVMSDQFGRFIEWQEYPTLTQVFSNVTPSTGSATVYVNQPINANYIPIGATYPATISVVLHNTTTAVPAAAITNVLTAQGAVVCGSLGASAVDITVTYVTAIGQNYDQICGQVMAIDPNLPPEGWLRWVEWSMQQKMQSWEYISWGYRPEDISTGYPYSNRMMGRILGDLPGLGIPGLTNGSNIEVQYSDVNIGTIPANCPVGTLYDVFVPNKPLVTSTLSVTVGTTPVNGTNLVFTDPTSGLVRFMTSDTSTADRPILATYKATGQIPGVPTNIDWVGAVGAIRIMLL